MEPSTPPPRTHTKTQPNLRKNTNISLNFTFPGFTLLENDQKRTFYVILWDYIGPLEIKMFAAKKFFFSKLQTDSSQSII